MKTFVIATEAGIKIETKENLKKNQVKKLESNFSEVKNFVEDKSGGGVVLTAHEKHIILGMMLQQVISSDMIETISKDTEMLMEDTIKFINDLSYDVQAEEEECEESKLAKHIDDVFQSLNDRFPETGFMILAIDRKRKEAPLVGNINPELVASALSRLVLYDKLGI